MSLFERKHLSKFFYKICNHASSFNAQQGYKINIDVTPPALFIGWMKIFLCYMDRFKSQDSLYMFQLPANSLLRIDYVKTNKINLLFIILTTFQPAAEYFNDQGFYCKS